MQSASSLFLSLFAAFVGDYVCALLLEKGISILQRRKFEKRFAFAIFLIILAVTALFKNLVTQQSFF